MIQSDPLTSYLVPLLTSIAVKTCLYLGIFKWRKHTASLMTCIILGAAMKIPSGFIGLLPLLGFAAGVGIAVVVLAQYTDVPLLFEGLIIIFGIEIGYAFLERLALAPLLY